MNYVRYPGSRLGPGKLAAHEKHRLMLLGSPPDMVRGFRCAQTGSSTRALPESDDTEHILNPRIRPCCSGLQVTRHRWLPGFQCSLVKKPRSYYTTKLKYNQSKIFSFTNEKMCYNV